MKIIRSVESGVNCIRMETHISGILQKIKNMGRGKCTG